MQQSCVTCALGMASVILDVCCRQRAAKVRGRRCPQIAQHGGACLRNPQILDGPGSLPYEKAAQCENGDVAPCSVLQHETGDEYPLRAWTASGDARLTFKGENPPPGGVAGANVHNGSDLLLGLGREEN